MAKDIRMDIVDRLETYCGGNGVSFAWALEGKSDGGLVVQFVRPDHTGHLTYRIKYSDIEGCNGKIDILIKDIKEKIKELCK